MGVIKRHILRDRGDFFFRKYKVLSVLFDKCTIYATVQDVLFYRLMMMYLKFRIFTK